LTLHGGETAINDLDKLALHITQDSQTLLAKWREQVKQLPSARQLDIPTLNDHIPDLLVELSEALKSRASDAIPEAVLEEGPPAHGLQRALNGFDIEEVVAEYNILRGCIHDLAMNQGIVLQGKPFHIINCVLDHAIGSAVRTYALQKALEVQRRREEYLSFVAHDLRTPLNAITVAAKVLELKILKGGADVEMEQLLKTLKRNATQLGALVAKVIEENSNLQTEIGVKLERRDVDLWPLVEAILLDLLPVAATSNAKLRNQTPGDLVVFADADLLRRVFQNLIANAVRYTQDGEVVVSAREAAGGLGVECWVTDNGAGIAEDRISKLFDPLETDPEKGDGLGFGLAIVKTFVEAHGGGVTVESTLGVGSTFRFTLPARPQ
jgi:signal transduction histidine kinase